MYAARIRALYGRRAPLTKPIPLASYSVASAALRREMARAGALRSISTSRAWTPVHPKRIPPAQDRGDQTYPNDAGYEAMGQAIDLHLLGTGG